VIVRNGPGDEGFFRGGSSSGSAAHHSNLISDCKPSY